MPKPRVITSEAARRFMLGQAGLYRTMSGAERPQLVQRLLRERRCIQLDPLDPIGTNADLVAMARIDGLKRGAVYQHLLPGHAFEHFAKERCLLPPSAFPYYRDQGHQSPWWRVAERQRRLPAEVVEAVLAEITERGPSTPAELRDRGPVEAMEWHGWKGTGRAVTMALEILWTRCQIVVCGREGRNTKRYDLPRRALATADDPAPPDGDRWALRDRAEACGLLSRNAGPWWSMLKQTRTSSLPDELVADQTLESVVIEGSRRRYLAPAGFMDRSWPDDDGRMRIIGPLDPLIWNRDLVRHIFDFDYVWEVYKPAAKRRWGWYVCPLLHHGRLVGRFEGHIEAGELVVDTLWKERGAAFDDAAFSAAIERHQANLSS